MWYSCKKKIMKIMSISNNNRPARMFTRKNRPKGYYDKHVEEERISYSSGAF